MKWRSIDWENNQIYKTLESILEGIFEISSEITKIQIERKNNERRLA